MAINISANFDKNISLSFQVFKVPSRHEYMTEMAVYSDQK